MRLLASELAFFVLLMVMILPLCLAVLALGLGWSADCLIAFVRGVQTQLTKFQQGDE